MKQEFKIEFFEQNFNQALQQLENGVALLKKASAVHPIDPFMLGRVNACLEASLKALKEVQETKKELTAFKTKATL